MDEKSADIEAGQTTIRLGTTKSDDVVLLQEACSHLEKALTIFKSFDWQWTVLDLRQIISATEEVINGFPKT